MKKKRNRLFVNIALIALSLCIMVYGVYAAKNASLTVNGTIGFTAHNIHYTISNFSVANALDVDGETYDVTKNALIGSLGSDIMEDTDDNPETPDVKTGVVGDYRRGGSFVMSSSTRAGTHSESGSNYDDTDHKYIDSSLYFDDLTYSNAEEDNIHPIIIRFKVTNYAMFNVQIDPVVAGTTAIASGALADCVTYELSVDYGQDANEDPLTAMAASTNGVLAGGEAWVTITLTLQVTPQTYTYVEVEEAGQMVPRPTAFAKNFGPVNFDTNVVLHLETPAPAQPVEPEEPEEPEEIAFTIDGDPFQAEAGMTWAQWILSEYTDLNWEENSQGGVRAQAGGTTWMDVLLNNEPVLINSAIVANGAYTFSDTYTPAEPDPVVPDPDPVDPEDIAFTIGETEMEAKEGMTWAEWLEEYKEAGYTTDSQGGMRLQVSENTWKNVLLNSAQVNATDTITKDGVYTLSELQQEPDPQP